ncbi:MAG: GNAT family N-acetyltransferase [Breznakibacter sp.]
MDRQIIVSFQTCDFTNEYHCTMVAELINQHLVETQGEGAALPKIRRLRLVDNLATHPSCFVLLAAVNDDIVGMASCVEPFSTVDTEPGIHIQDFVVTKAFRGIGIETTLLDQCLNFAAGRNCHKVTIIADNHSTIAPFLQKGIGFEKTDTGSWLWQEKKMFRRSD